MKKLSVFGLFAMLAILLAACTGGGGTSPTPTTTGGGLGGLTTNVAPTTAATTGGVATSAATSVSGAATSVATSAGTTVPSTGGLATSTSSVPSTGGLATSTTSAVVGTPAATSAVGTTVPSTGGAQIGQFARLHDLMNFNDLDSSNNSLGTIQDFVINIPKTRVDYIVLNYNGKTILVPWSTLAFNRTAGNSFSFNGNMTNLQNVPAFNANNIDWTSPTWDQDVINAWKGLGAGANATAIATGVPSTGGTSQMTGTGTPMAQSTTSVGGVPSTGARQVAILASQLSNVQVVENTTGGVPSTGGNSMSGTPAAGATSNGSMVNGTGTPAASTSSGTGSTGSTTGSVPATGNALGTIQDGIVNMTSGDLPFFLLSSNGITNTGTTGSTASSTAVGTMSTTMVAITPVATSSAAGGSTSNTTGTSVPSTGAMGSGRFVPVPSNLLLFVGNNQAILQVATSMLSNAPVLDFSQTPVLNFGWDAQYFNYWQNGSSNAGGGTGSGTGGTGTATGTATP